MLPVNKKNGAPRRDRGAPEGEAKTYGMFALLLYHRSKIKSIGGL